MSMWNDCPEPDLEPPEASLNYHEEEDEEEVDMTAMRILPSVNVSTRSGKPRTTTGATGITQTTGGNRE